jgi:hypothetical protein
MQKKKGTLISHLDKDGKKHYFDNATGKEVRLDRKIGKHMGRIPNGIYGRFIKPAPTPWEKM